ncbi:hypothetical protein, partial [Limnofasciculus baicalensis]
ISIDDSAQEMYFFDLATPFSDHHFLVDIEIIRLVSSIKLKVFFPFLSRLKLVKKATTHLHLSTPAIELSRREQRFD